MKLLGIVFKFVLLFLPHAALSSTSSEQQTINGGMQMQYNLGVTISESSCRQCENLRR